MLSFNNSSMRASLTHHGCHGGVIKACFETCEEPVSFVSYSQAGTDFFITSYAVHPYASLKEAQLAGDLINQLLEAEAHKLGIRRLLIVPPHQDTAVVIEEYKVQPFVMSLGITNMTNAHIN